MMKNKLSLEEIKHMTKLEVLIILSTYIKGEEYAQEEKEKESKKETSIYHH